MQTGSTSKIQKVLGENAIPDAPTAGIGNKKLLQSAYHVATVLGLRARSVLNLSPVLGSDVMLKKDDTPARDKRRPPQRRASVRVKNAAIFPLDIPEVLNSKFSVWYQTHLMFQNYLVTTYRSCGTIAILVFLIFSYYRLTDFFMQRRFATHQCKLRGFIDY